MSDGCLNTVYPRWRGEHFRNGERPVPYAGLSPLARGTLMPFVTEIWLSRFIPAGAGNTFETVNGLFPMPVYPRWRGEH